MTIQDSPFTCDRVRENGVASCFFSQRQPTRKHLLSSFLCAGLWAEMNVLRFMVLVLLASRKSNAPLSGARSRGFMLKFGNVGVVGFRLAFRQEMLFKHSAPECI